MRKPRVITKCVANTYSASNERIAEFAGASGNGGLMSLREQDNGRLRVELYHLDGCDVVTAQSVALAELLKVAHATLADIESMVGDKHAFGCTLDDENHPWFETARDLAAAIAKAEKESSNG